MTIYHQLGQDMLFWFARGTEGVQWSDIGVFLPLGAIGLLGAIAISPAMGVMALGEQVATALGRRARMTRFLAAVTVLVLAGEAYAGRRDRLRRSDDPAPRVPLVGWDYRVLVPAAALLGALLVLVADIGARLLSAPFNAAVPVSVVTSLIGVPFFVYLITRRKLGGRGAFLMGGRRRRSATILVLVTLVAISAAAVNLFIGGSHVSLRDIAAVLTGEGGKWQTLVLLQMRLPRLILCVLIGAGTAVAGALYQGLSRNDLASPDTLGINAGSGLGMMLLLVVFPSITGQSPLVVPIGCVLGAMATMALMYALAYRRGSVLPTRLLLTGVAIGFGAHAAMLLFSLRMSWPMYNQVLTWMSGTLAASNWTSVLSAAALRPMLLPVAASRARVLNAFSLGDGIATSLGIAVARERTLLLATATLLTSTSIAVGGHIGFLGLAVPHLARRLVGINHVKLLPVAALCGATLLLVADVLSKVLFAPVKFRPAFSSASWAAPISCICWQPVGLRT